MAYEHPAETVWRQTGFALSDKANFYLENDILLPGEMIVVALSGHVKGVPSCIFATRTLIGLLEDTQEVTWKDIDVGAVTGYQSTPRRDGTELLIHTEGGVLALNGAHSGATTAFIHGLQHLLDIYEVMPSFLLPIGESIQGILDELSDLVTDARVTDALDHRSPGEVIGDDFSTAVGRAVLAGKHPIVYEVAWAMLVHANLARPDRMAGRGFITREVLDQCGDQSPILLTAWPQLQPTDLGNAWRDLLTKFAGTIRMVAALLPPTAPNTAREAFAREAARFANLGTSGASRSSLSDLLARLDSMIGIPQAKGEVHALVNAIRVHEMRAQAGLKASTPPRHLVFVGNPGTGKTTVARIVGLIYQALGLLPSGQVIEVARSDLVAGYVGQTAIKTQAVFSKARGGVLFIDEAYSLARSSDESDFGREAIDTLVKQMEDHRDDTVIIFAGYEHEMDRFIQSNPGLSSRIGRFIHFGDYTPGELVQIATKIADEMNYSLGQGVADRLAEELHHVDPRTAGNGRLARRAVEDAVLRHSNRVAQMSNPSLTELRTLELSDFAAAPRGVAGSEV